MTCAGWDQVEIGGDSQSTDGTESSHMHDSETVDLHTGYECLRCLLHLC